LPVAAFYRTTAEGCAAIEAVLGSGLQPSALEYLDAVALGAAAPAFPGDVPAGAAFAVLAEADGPKDEAARAQRELAEVLANGAVALERMETASAVEALWRWRDGVSLAVSS